MFLEIVEYSLETANIDMGTPKRSAQPTQGVQDVRSIRMEDLGGAIIF